MAFSEHWEREAQNWIAWTRTPGHDVYRHYRDAFLALVPEPGAATLEIGCGEGRVSRDLAAEGHAITAIDAAPTLLNAAAEAHPEGTYRLADAADLPFADGSFDTVVAYNSLMDVGDLRAAVREAARVLTPAGKLCVCVTHPLNDAGAFSGPEPDAPFTIPGDYLTTRPFKGRFERGGLAMTFHGQCHPLEAYAQALEDAGLRIEALREPAAPAALVEQEPSAARWRRLPMFLMFRAGR
jgi:SAM-dependent methyltransferase